MAIRFRRTMKIAPGVRLNLTKTGVSARVGPKGVGMTVGASGTTLSAGLPGTGIHVSEMLTKGNVSKAKHRAVSAPDEHLKTEHQPSSRRSLGFLAGVE